MPVKGRKLQAFIAFLSLLAVVFIDQTTKFLIHLSMIPGQSVPIIKNVLHITYVTNSGGAFGVLRKGTLIFIVISIIAILLIGSLIVRSIKSGRFLSSPIFDIGLILIIAGAIGNLIDRLRYTYVIDFIDVRIWPVFNIADSSITIGTCLLIFSLLIRPR